MDVHTVTADAESFTCNAYLVEGDATVLVDAGAMDGVADVVAEHADVLDAVALTHQHGDHVDQLDAVLDRFDADVYAYAQHPRRTHALDDGDELAIGDGPFEAVYTPGHDVDQLDAVLDRFDADVYAYAQHPRRTHALDDGDELRIGDAPFEAVYTPGHADDHLAFVGESTLFSGDVVVHDDGAFDDGSFGRTDMPGQSRETLIESIERLLDRMPGSVEHMYAGHGGEFHGDVRDVVETALRRAEKREPKYD